MRGTLGREVDGASLGFFRIVWGLIIVGEGLIFLKWTADVFAPGRFHFHYGFAPFIEPLPSQWMTAAEIYLLMAGGILVALGVAFRPASLMIAVLYTHLVLIERAVYNNHFYLIALIAWLMVFTKADRCFRVGVAAGRHRGEDPAARRIPFWNLFLLRAQVVLVYFYGGIAKLDSDWLAGEPLRHWLVTHRVIYKPPASWIPELFAQEWVVYAMSWGGMLLDLTVGFLLLGRRTFWAAAALLVGFHVINNSIFPIGTFPWLGIGLLAVFLRPEGPRRFFGKFLAAGKGGTREDAAGPDAGRPASPAVTAGVAIFLAIQVLLPLRHFAYGRNASWTEVGHAFAWRMMLRHKDGVLDLYFEPADAARTLADAGKFPELTPLQQKEMVVQPALILQYVRALSRSLEQLGRQGVAIRVASVVSMNGRPFQLMIDPGADLARASMGGFGVPDWILPLPEALPIGNYPEPGEAMVAEAREVYRRALAGRGEPAGKGRAAPERE